jgi:F0F1-type ATP synthase epsilon subunit
MANKKTINLTVRDTKDIIFQGEVDRISSYNEVGRFDIYPMHANFISILQQEITLFQNKQQVKKIEIEQAVLKIKQDVANIFLGIENLLIE